MAVYVVTGKLGSGKTLVAVSKIQEYLNQGRMVATNLDLNLEHLVNPFAKSTRVMRIPDKPSAEDLESLPEPYDLSQYNESKTGLLVFDECATWFNSRTWNDKSRRGLIDWLLHARKKGWDIIFIIQNVSMMDSQAREGFAEHVVHCRRLDRLSIPVITWVFRMAGITVRPPKIHWGIVKYGAAESSPLIERWAYRGTQLYDAYDTGQIFSEGSCGMHSMLPPNTIYGRYTNAREHAKRQFIHAFNKRIQGFEPRGAFFVGLLVAGLAAFIFQPAQSAQNPVAESAKTSIPVQAESVPEQSHPMDGTYITASVKYASGFDYVFETGDRVVYPEMHGYTVRYINSCKANLYSDTESLYLTCSPYRSSEAQLQPRDVAGAGETSDTGIVPEILSAL